MDCDVCNVDPGNECFDDCVKPPSFSPDPQKQSQDCNLPSASFFLKQSPSPSTKKQKKRDRVSNGPQNLSPDVNRSPIKKILKRSGSKTKLSPEALDVQYCEVDYQSPQSPLGFRAHTWNPNNFPIKSKLRGSQTCEGVVKRQKHSLRFGSVSVFYFDHAEGFDTLPSSGEVALGMTRRHHASRVFSLNRGGQPFIEINEPPDSPLSSDEECPELPERDSARNIYSLNRKQISKKLKSAGVPIIKKSVLENEILRQQRKYVGCSCPDGICLPETCQCAIDGIKCQFDGCLQDLGPCQCTVAAGCENPEGRVEFRPDRVAEHSLAVRQRLRHAELCGTYSLPSRRRLDSDETNNSYCNSPSDKVSEKVTIPASTLDEVPKNPKPLGLRKMTSFKALPKFEPKQTSSLSTEEIPLKLRLRRSTSIDRINQESTTKSTVMHRSASTTALPKTMQETSTRSLRPRMHRTSSLVAMPTPENKSELVKSPSMPELTNIKEKLRSPSKPLLVTPSRPLPRLSSASRLRFSGMSAVDLRAAAPNSDQPSQRAVPLRVGIAPPVSKPPIPPKNYPPTSTEKAFLRFPVTPVYSRIPQSKLQLHPAVNLQEYNSPQYVPSISTSTSNLVAASAVDIKTRRLSPAKSFAQLPQHKLE